jgi:hypothetical protein
MTIQETVTRAFSANDIVFFEAHLAGTVGDDDLLSQLVAQLLRHFGTEDRFVDSLEKSAGTKFERLASRVVIV